MSDDPSTFSNWLSGQRHRQDQVGFIARLAFDHAEYVELKSALTDPDHLGLTYRDVEGKVANSVREALKEWKAGRAISRR